MIASILCVLLAFIAVANAQTACFSGKFCTNTVAVAGRFTTAQSCVNACPLTSWASYTAGTGWCGCAATCSTQVANPGYQTYCPITAAPSFRPTANPTAKPTAKPTANPTAKPTALNKCYPGSYCSYNMNVVSSTAANEYACLAACNTGAPGCKFFTYVPSTGWCACAGAGQCSNRVANPNADTYCIK